MSPIFLCRFSYQASPYAIDDRWCNITARCCRLAGRAALTASITVVGESHEFSGNEPSRLVVWVETSRSASRTVRFMFRRYRSSVPVAQTASLLLDSFCVLSVEHPRRNSQAKKIPEHRSR